jgi:hypothetical protein
MATLTLNSGEFNHLLDLSPTPGTVTSPIFVTATSPLTTTVQGFAVTPIGTTVSLGSYVANTELPFRMTNVIASTDTINNQLFTGTFGDTHNPGGEPAAFVFTATSTESIISFTEHPPFAASPIHLQFALTLAPVPEPSTYALMLAGLGFVGFVASRRRKSQALVTRI